MAEETLIATILSQLTLEFPDVPYILPSNGPLIVDSTHVPWQREKQWLDRINELLMGQNNKDTKRMSKENPESNKHAELIAYYRKHPDERTSMLNEVGATCFPAARYIEALEGRLQEVEGDLTKRIQDLEEEVANLKDELSEANEK